MKVGDHPDGDAASNEAADDGDMTDMLGELRVLLPTAQLLSGFLIAVPFAAGFRTIIQAEKHVFLATFLLSMASLVLFTAPAVQHRLMRPLRQRARFKTLASRQMLTGAGLLSVALVLATQFVLSEVLGEPVANVAAAGIGVLIAAMWFTAPLLWKRGQAR